METVELPGIDVHLLVKTDLDKYYGDPAKPDQNSYGGVAARIEEDLAWIYSRVALNEATAITYLVELGIMVAALLEHSRLERPELTTSVAKNFVEWPMTVTTEADALKTLTNTRKQLKLGEGIQIRSDKIKYTREEMVQLKVVYHCLVIFDAISKVNTQMRKSKLFQAVIDATSTVPSVSTISPFTQRMLQGELTKGSKRIKTVGTKSKQSKRALIALLKLPIPPNYVASPEVASVLADARNLPPLAANSKGVWFELIVKFLVTLSGAELEENEKLRTVGDSAGDVVVREHCKTYDSEEFNAMKIALRHDADVNGAIRSRIKERLKKALDKFT